MVQENALSGYQNRRKEGFFVNENELKALLAEAVRDADLHPNEIPSIDLYLDQITSLADEKRKEGSPRFADRALTKTMINNYVKQHLITPPVKKRYDKEQIARLYCICLLKRVFSISEVKRLLEVQMCSYPFPQAYDYFCVELEKALQATFSTRDFSAPSSAQKVTPESELVRLSALAFANKLFAIKFLEMYDLSRLNESSK
mgnify:CR=1 FL=1